ncbi:MAG TPA: SDR family NAD(P)-dependent oxidoreductase [Pirellulales bacterium]|jgi:NAD(P)-dependent dehydrogenase (short-subunit alcohol dehydrogenase family)|nr:SDR family NAD(P)-dependent oxidoreductase [Pirellulales bacterium]
MKTSGRTFLVTGGSSGLGAACARRFVAEGAAVVIADLNRAEGEVLSTELGNNARFVETNVTDEGSVARAVAAAAEGMGGLAGVVQCAGIVEARRVVGRDGPHPLALFAKVVEVNLIGTFNVLRLAAARLSAAAPDAEGERGVIINTSSISASEGQIGQAAYSASKAGVAGMTLPVARELAALGIRVVTIAPGIFDTPMLACMSDAVRESLGRQVPFPPRLGRPDEYAALVVHVIENRMLNGAVLRIDGALRMAAK